jgi:hypothetical protein
MISLYTSCLYDILQISDKTEKKNVNQYLILNT